MPILPKQLTLDQLQTKWPAIIDPILKNPASNPSILKNISLVTGSNVINHLLGQPLQGWYMTRIRSLASIYDTQDTNPTPQLTLVLVSSADVIIDLAVF